MARPLRFLVDDRSAGYRAAEPSWDWRLLLPCIVTKIDSAASRPLGHCFVDPVYSQLFQRIACVDCDDLKLVSWSVVRRPDAGKAVRRIRGKPRAERRAVAPIAFLAILEGKVLIEGPFVAGRVQIAAHDARLIHAEPVTRQLQGICADGLRRIGLAVS